MSDGPSHAAVEVVTGAPTEEETAAIAAVFAQLVLERAARVERIPDAPHRSAWDLSRRALRTPLDRR